MTFQVHQRGSQVAPPSGARPRRAVLASTAAVLSIALLCWSLYRIAEVHGEGDELVRRGVAVVDQRERYASLADMAADVNAAGNDVFESHDVVRETARMEAALAPFWAELRSAQAHLSANESAIARAPLALQLTDIESAMARMESQARRVFSLFGKNDRDEAERARGAMNREFATIDSAMRALQAAVSRERRGQFDGRVERMAVVRRYELLAGLGALLLLLVIVANDRRATRAVAGSLVEQEKQLAALQQSEEQLRLLTVALEERVSERTRELADANAQLGESEAELRTLIESMSDVIVLFGTDGTYRKVFETGTSSLIRSPAELRGRNIRDTLPAAALEYVRGKIAEVIEAGVPVSLEYGMPVRDRHLWFRGVASPIGEQQVLWVARDVTKRKLAEDQLSRRQKQLAESQRIAHVGSWECDLPTTAIEWSEETYRICGVDPSEFAPTLEGYIDLVHPDDRERVAHSASEGRRTGNAYRTEHRVVRPDGGVVAIVADVHFVREGDRLVRAVGVLQDVTERVASREALRAQQAFLQQVIDTAPSLIFVKDREGRFTFVNQATANAFGVGVDDLIGKTDADFGHTAAQIAAFRREDLAVLESGAPVIIPEESITDGAGKTRWLQTVKVPIANQSGQAGHVLGVSTDIGDRREADRRVRESERQLAVAQRLARLGSWQWDLAAGELTWSAETYRQLDYDRLHVVPMFELVLARTHPDDREQLVAATQHTLETGEPLAFDTRYLYDDGSIRHFTVHAEVTRDDGGRAILLTGTALDVTEQMQAEAALREARTAAEAASEAKSEFLANVSHEIRTPMNGVLGMLEIALDDELAPELRDCLQTAHASAESLLGIISDILDLSKIEAGQLSFEPVPFSLRDSVADATSALAVAAHQQGLELAVEVSADVPDALIGDPSRLRQVIVNLIGNATKFTPQGEVVLRVADATDDAGADGGVLLHFIIADTGIGIAPEKQGLVFDAFQQADTSTTREFGGTGLGLTIVAQLVAGMEGRVWLESEPGKGSTFHFTARFGLQTVTAPAAHAGGEASDDLVGMPVLVVDDNRTSGEILCRMLQGWGMRATLATDGFDALARIIGSDQSDTRFGALLIDSGMPDMDGFSLVEGLAQRHAEVGATVMMLDASRYREEAARCRALGVRAYVAKPAAEAQLRRAMRLAVDAERVSITGERRIPRGAARTRAERESAGPLRILLAEDNRVNQKLACALLERAGHSVVVVDNGREAVEAVERALSAPFDVVLMDVHMPEMGGLEATAEIRQNEAGSGQRIPIIAVTARAMAGDRQTCLAAGMDGYLLKPISARTLREVIAETMARMSGSPHPLRDEPVAGERAEGRVLDERRFLDMVGGDRELLAELAGLFLRDYPGQVAEMRAALERGDARALQFGAHALKGAAGTVQAPGVADAALRVEEQARAHDLADAALLLARLDEELAALHPRIREFAGS